MVKDTKPEEWLMNLVLGAAATLPVGPEGLMSKGTFSGSAGTFEIFGRAPNGSPIVQTAVWKLYAAQLPSGQMGLMKIAASPAQNAVLEWEAEILRKLQKAASRADDEAESQSRRPYYFGAQFPVVVESMDAGGRHAMFLAFHESITTYKQFTPLSLVVKDERVDFQTGVWLLGKSLRLLDFVYRLCGMTIGYVGASNVLIETEQHAVFILDFSRAEEYAGSTNYHKVEVAAAARMVWHACGGSEVNDPLHDPDIMTVAQYTEFVSFLRRIMDGKTDGAREEHEQLYSLADRIWPRQEVAPGVSKRDFHEFTTYPR